MRSMLYFAMVTFAAAPIHAQEKNVEKNAPVQLHAIFQDNMVLQRGPATPIWGKAAEGVLKVQVELKVNGKNSPLQFVYAKGVGPKGSEDFTKWVAYLDLSTVDLTQEYVLVVSGTGKMPFAVPPLKGVYIGDVWLAVGQSNMAAKLGEYHATELKSAQDPIKEIGKFPKFLRYLTLLDCRSEMLVDYIREPGGDRDPKELRHPRGQWRDIGPDKSNFFELFPTIPFFFAKELLTRNNVPVGIICASVGGSEAEQWMSRESMMVVGKPYRELANYYKSPSLAGLYHGMIAPLVPFSIKGFLWYQGEVDAQNDRSSYYEDVLTELIKNYRSDWQDFTLPFYFVQIAPWMKTVSETDKRRLWRDALPEIREGQRQVARKIPHTGMVVSTDFGATVPHPVPKRYIGERLAALALENTYGLKFKEGSRRSLDLVRVHFNDRGKGVLTLLSDESSDDLIVKKMVERDIEGGETNGRGNRAEGDGDVNNISGFKIAGPNRVFEDANAKLVGKKVVVWSEKVPEPIAIRYGWDDYPVCELFGKNGLPVTPFRTDDFPLKGKILPTPK